MAVRTAAVALAGLLAAIGTATAGRIDIVSEADIASSWVPAPDAPRVIAGYPASAADKAQDVCVNIGFLINKDGSTSNFIQMKAWSSRAPMGAEPKPELVQAYVQTAAAAVSMWRFVPAAGKAKPVYTSASFAFEGSKSATAAQIVENCRIPDLQAFVEQAKQDENRRGNLDRASIQREQMQNGNFRPD